jgi:predicted nucleotidyltransferase
MNMELVTETQLVDMARVMGLASGAARVVLFGSAARGTATASSDLDFLLVIPDSHWNWQGSTLEKLEPAMRARQAARAAGYWMALDVLPLPESRYGDSRSYLASEVKRDGVTLFEAGAVNA